MDFSERVQVYISEDTYRVLVHDARYFEVLKKDNLSINMNGFISDLICNYYDDYRRALINIKTSIDDTIQRNYHQKLSLPISDEIGVQFYESSSEQRPSVKLTIKPTKKTVAIMY